MKRVIKGGVVLLLVIAVYVAAGIISAKTQSPPKLLANVTDLNKIEKISKYRSCQGHVTVPQNQRETRRNMKHYFWVRPEFNKGNTVAIYAPYDGFVTVLRNEPALNLEGEIGIVPDRGIFAALPPIGVWMYSVQHIDVRGDLRMGSKVKTGELIGYAALSEKRGNSFDIVYGKFSMTPTKIDNWTAPFIDLDSVFNHMSQTVFAEYKEKGANSANDFIINKEERDSSPCEYRDGGPYFAPSEGERDWVFLK